MSRFKKLSHVLWHSQYHNVWVPKYRHRVLTGEVGQEVKNCINCIQVFSGQLGCEVVELNIQQDHIHLISNLFFRNNLCAPRIKNWISFILFC